MTNARPTGRRAEGTERHEPGKPTRKHAPQVDKAARDIGRQQGTTQRGYTGDARPTARGPGRASRGRT
jgi:hypothetical protein